MSEFHADAKRDDGGGDGEAGQSFHRVEQAAGEAESVEKSEAE